MTAGAQPGISEDVATILVKAQGTGGQGGQQLDLTPARLPALKDTIGHGDAHRTTLVHRQTIYNIDPGLRRLLAVCAGHGPSVPSKTDKGHLPAKHLRRTLPWGS